MPLTTITIELTTIVRVAGNYGTQVRTMKVGPKASKKKMTIPEPSYNSTKDNSLIRDTQLPAG
jgi:hypothetical protein